MASWSAVVQLVVHEPLGSCVEVVEDVLLVTEHAVAVPLLALLPAATEVRHRPDAAGLDPGQHGGGEAWRQRHAEAAVAVEDGRARSGRDGVGGALIARGDDEHAHLGAVSRGVGDLAGGHGGDVHGPGRRGPEAGRPRPRVIVLDGRGRRVVGVAEPCLVPTLGSLDDAADGAEPGQRHLSEPGARGQVVDRHLGDRMPGPRREQHRGGQLAAVQDCVAVEHGDRVLGQQRPPTVGSERVRGRDAETAPRGVEVGEDQHPAVPADLQPGLGVDIDLDGAQIGSLQRRGRQVGEEEIVARRGALRRRHLQPAAVAAD